MLAEAGIHTFFNGPESFTPDDAYHLGLAHRRWTMSGWLPGSTRLGFSPPGGAGHGAEPSGWIRGEKPFDLGDVDISRMQPFQGNKNYLFERSKETLGLLYADHYPYRQKAHGARCAPDTVSPSPACSSGAVMGEIGRLGTGQLVCQ